MKNAAISRRAEKITPRWPSRIDSRPRFKALLDALEALLDEFGPSEVSVQMIAEKAGMPPASVYHFFPSSDAACVALATTYLGEFVAQARTPLAVDPYGGWQDGIRRRAEVARAHYLANTACMRLLLGSDMPRDIQTLDASNVAEMGKGFADDIRRQFIVPEFDRFDYMVTNAIEISDAFWRMSYCRHQTITDEAFEESVRAVIAYMRTYLPDTLQVRSAALAPTPTPSPPGDIAHILPKSRGARKPKDPD